MKNERGHLAGSLAVLLGALLALGAMGGCSIRKLAVNSAGNALAEGTSSWTSDDDPVLVGQALPFALKTIESLLADSPRHRGLLLAASSGFTQYAYAYLQCEADYREESDLQAASELRLRARKLYRRGRDYGLRGLEVSYPGFGVALRGEGGEADLARLEAADVPLLYWTAAAWGSLISLAKDEGEVTADLPLVAAMMQRALVLEPTFGDGAIEDFFISYEGGRAGAAGGSLEKAREAFERSMALGKGRRAAPLVSLAETVCVASQDRASFEQALKEALAIDPDAVPELRLANLIAQKRARWLLGRAQELFLE